MVKKPKHTTRTIKRWFNDHGSTRIYIWYRELYKPSTMRAGIYSIILSSQAIPRISFQTLKKYPINSIVEYTFSSSSENSAGFGFRVIRFLPYRTFENSFTVFQNWRAFGISKSAKIKDTNNVKVTVKAWSLNNWPAMP